MYTIEFDELQTYLSQPHVAGLVIPSVDRWSREATFESAAHLTRPLTQLVGGKSTKRLWTDDKEWDVTKGDAQDFIWRQLREAESERKKTTYRTSRDKQKKRANPKASVDRRPDGILHTRDPKNPKKNEGVFSYTDEIRTKMHTAYHRALRGDSIHKIAAESGFDSPTALRKSLRSKWWVGYYTNYYAHIKSTVFDKGKGEFPTKRVDLRIQSEEVLALGRLPLEVRIPELTDNPVVTLEVWEAVQAILDVHRDTHKTKKSIRNEFLGTGFLFCKCGRKMYHLKEGKRKYKRYECASKQPGHSDCKEPAIRADIIDPEIALQAILKLTNDEFLDKCFAESLNAAATEEKKRAVQRQTEKIAALDKEEANCYQNLRKGIGSADHWAKQLKEIEIEKAESKNTLRTAEERD